MISGLLASAFAVNIAGYPPRDPGLVKLWGSPKAASGAEVNTRTVLGLSAVFRGVNIIGNDVAKCRPFIYERLGENGRPDPHGRDKRRAMEHPSWRRVVRQANQWMSAGEFRKTLTFHAMLRGNGIGHVERDGAGRIREYFPLLPDRTGMAVFNTRIRDDSRYPESEGGEVMYWTIVGGQMRPILPENIVHIRGPAQNGVWGLDIVEVMRETLGLAIAARDCGARFYGQGMLGSGILYMPSGLTKGVKGEETVANFIKSVKDQVQGLSRAHKLLVLEEGAKFEKMSVDPEQAQALETREFEVREIANIVGCQPHKLGDTKRTSYASLEQSNQEHLDDDIDPWLTRWEEALEDSALTEVEKESGSHFIECNRKALLRTNLAARGAYYGQARNGGWMSANDIRRAEGDDPIGGQGDTYLVPANMTPADQAGAAFNAAPAGIKLRSNCVGAADQAGAAFNAAPAGGNDEDDGEDRQKKRGDDEQARLAADYRALALHEVQRFARRTLAAAERKSAKGGREFVAFLESIHGSCNEPAQLRTVLGHAADLLFNELNKFTEPPFLASELRQNVAAASDAIAQRVVAWATEHLPIIYVSRSKAA